MNRLIVLSAGVLTSSSLLLVDATIKGSVILLLAASLAVLMRRDSAAARHQVWLVGVVAILAIPFLSGFLPHLRVLPNWAAFRGEPVASIAVAANQSTEPTEPYASDPPPSGPMLQESPVEFPGDSGSQLDEGPYEPVATDHPARVPAHASQQGTSDDGDLFAILSVLWTMGVLLLLVRLLAARLLLWVCERNCREIAVSHRGSVNVATRTTGDQDEERALLKVFAEATEQLNIRQHVVLMTHGQRNIPIVWGLWKSRLLLPATAASWSTEQQRSVLLHELAHIGRRDTLTQLLSQIACSVYWFNPLVWFAAWRLHVERERACDDLVLSRGVLASTYAEHLLNVAPRGGSPWTGACGLAMASRSSLEGRLVAVLSKSENRRTVTSLVVGLSLLVGGAIATPVAMLRASSPQQEAEADDNESTESAPAAASADEREPTALPTPKNEKARQLLARWQKIEERSDLLNNNTIDRMRRGIDSWVRQPPAKQQAAAVLAIRDWGVNRNEHPVGEVVQWLDRIAAIHEGPIQFALNGERRLGRKLTAQESKVLSFGPVSENGLRVAWSRSPVKPTYHIGEVIQCALLIQNTTQQTIEFKCPYSLYDVVDWDVSNGQGEKLKVDRTWLTGSVALFTFHLKPGEVAEIFGYGGLTIGKTEPRPLTQLNVQAGQRVTVRWNVTQPCEMQTGPVSFVVAKGPPPTITKTGQSIVLPAETENALRWGRPVEGLRAALSRLPSIGKEKPGYMDFDLVLQNVSDTPIKLVTSGTHPDVRMVRVRQDGSTLFGLKSPKHSGLDVTLKPKQSVVIEVFTSDELVDDQGRVIADKPEFTFYGVFEIAKSPSGAWSGKLSTPETSGAVISGKRNASSAKATPGSTLSEAVQRRARWGTTVNGLRAAVLVREITDSEQDVVLAVQNVSDGEIVLNDSDPQNEHTYFEKLDGELQSAYSSPQQRFGHVRLRPQQVAFLSVFPPRADGPGRPTGDAMAEILLKTSNLSVYGKVQFVNVPEGTYSGKLTTGETSGIEAAPASLRFGGRIDPAVEKRLRWGKPSDGLRAALAIRDEVPDLYLAVQNVGQVPALLNDRSSTSGHRVVSLFQGDTFQSRTRIVQPTMSNVLLRPGDVTYVRLVREQEVESEASSRKGQLLADALLNKPDMMLTAEWAVAAARPGAWTGTLLTGMTDGESAKPGPKLKSAKSVKLFKRWTAGRD